MDISLFGLREAFMGPNWQPTHKYWMHWIHPAPCLESCAASTRRYPTHTAFINMASSNNTNWQRQYYTWHDNITNWRDIKSYMSFLKDKQDNSETQLLLLKILSENFKSFLSPQTLNKSIWRVILMAFTLNSKLDHDSSFVIRVIAAHTEQEGGTRFAPDYLV